MNRKSFCRQRVAQRHCLQTYRFLELSELSIGLRKTAKNTGLRKKLKLLKFSLHGVLLIYYEDADYLYIYVNSLAPRDFLRETDNGMDIRLSRETPVI